MRFHPGPILLRLPDQIEGGALKCLATAGAAIIGLPIVKTGPVVQRFRGIETGSEDKTGLARWQPLAVAPSCQCQGRGEARSGIEIVVNDKGSAIDRGERTRQTAGAPDIVLPAP